MQTIADRGSSKASVLSSTRFDFASAMKSALDTAIGRLTSDSSLYASYVSRPVDYVRDVLGVEPWEKQIDILDALNRPRARVSVSACNSSGKTWIAAAAASWFLNTRPSIVLTTAPTARQVSQLLWREMRRQTVSARRSLLGKILGREPRWEIAEKWYALGFSTDELERFQGFHALSLLVIEDEASGVDDGINDAIEGVLSSGDARLLKIGNPTQTSGHFFDDFHNNRGIGGRQSFTISAFDTPNLTASRIGLSTLASELGSGAIEGRDDDLLLSSGSLFPFLVSPEWVEEKRLEWGEDSDLWRVRVLGEFPRGAINTVIALSDLDRARLRELPIPLPGEIELGVDVARYGDDRSVIVVRAGPCVLYIEEITKRDTVYVAGRTSEIANTYSTLYQTTPYTARIKVDDSSMGGGVTDQLIALGQTGVVPIIASSTSIMPSRYPNRRSDLWFATAERSRDNMLDLSRLTRDTYDRLVAELTAPKWKMDLQGRRVVEPKDAFKARLKRSPDIADALNLAFAIGSTASDGWSGTLNSDGRETPTGSAVLAW